MSRLVLPLWFVPLLILGCKAPGTETSTASPQRAPSEQPRSIEGEESRAEDEGAIDQAPAPGFPDEIQRVNDCSTSAESLLGEAETALIHCPANCGAKTFSGTSVYPTTAPACTSQVHAGILSRDGGLVLVTRTEGLQKYRGSLQFGIKTSDFGYFRLAFYGQRVSDDGHTTTPVPTPRLD
jgi:hypothetical protein